MTDRMDRLTTALREQQLDLLVLNPSPSFTWVSGNEFESHERLFLLMVPAKGDPVAVVPALEEVNFRTAMPGIERVFLWEDKDGADGAARDACAALGEIGSVAIEPLALRYMEYSVLQRFLGSARFVPADAVTDALRRVKDEAESAAIRRAAEIAEAALDATVKEVRVGHSERQIAASLSSRLLVGGGEGISFGPIVLGGPHSALPHGVPGDRRLETGDLLLIDFGTSFDGYHCDITRTFVVGDADERTRSVYEAVRAGNEAGCRAASAEATSHEVHTAAQAPLLVPEFREFMTHRTGHGLGLDIHEPPSVMEGNHESLGVGTVITVEPGLYLEGWGGVRIEDDILVTASGPEWLTSFDRSLRKVGE